LGIFFLRAAPGSAEAAQKLPDGQISLVMTMDCFAAFVHARLVALAEHSSVMCMVVVSSYVEK
jgi:hypothetical protein